MRFKPTLAIIFAAAAAEAKAFWAMRDCRPSRYQARRSGTSQRKKRQQLRRQHPHGH